jgi:hypothetical protein
VSTGIVYGDDMPILDRQDIIQQATVPDNLDQPPKFGAITECVKDAFLLELRHFFNTAYTQARVGELPRIDKYAVAGDVSTDPLETAVNLIRSYPDIAEDLPLIAVLATTGRNSKLCISGHHVALVVPDAKVVSSIDGPFVLTYTNTPLTITLTSQPDGTVAGQQTSTFTLPNSMFLNIAAATLDEVISAINIQALYVQAFKDVTGPVVRLGIKAGGPSGVSFPNKITLTGGTALAALGFTVGQADQNYGAGKHALYRHYMAADLGVEIEVVAESENVRTELTDLLYDFVSYTLADRMYTFYGRSTFDNAIADETYQIIIRDNEISFGGEQEVPRTGDPRDKIYINRLSIPVTAIMYSDRIATDKSGAAIQALPPNLVILENIPLPN